MSATRRVGERRRTTGPHDEPVCRVPALDRSDATSIARRRYAVKRVAPAAAWWEGVPSGKVGMRSGPGVRLGRWCVSHAVRTKRLAARRPRNRAPRSPRPGRADCLGLPGTHRTNPAPRSRETGGLLRAAPPRPRFPTILGTSSPLHEKRTRGAHTFPAALLVQPGTADAMRERMGTPLIRPGDVAHRGRGSHSGGSVFLITS